MVRVWVWVGVGIIILGGSSIFDYVFTTAGAAVYSAFQVTRKVVDRFPLNNNMK